MSSCCSFFSGKFQNTNFWRMQMFLKCKNWVTWREVTSHLHVCVLMQETITQKVLFSPPVLDYGRFQVFIISKTIKIFRRLVYFMVTKACFIAYTKSDHVFLLSQQSDVYYNSIFLVASWNCSSVHHSPMLQLNHSRCWSDF